MATPLLAGLAIGVFLTSVIVGYRTRRATAQRQLNDLEDAIPEWVNRGTGIWPPIVIDIDAVIDAIDECVRQQRLEDAAPWN